MVTPCSAVRVQLLPYILCVPPVPLADDVLVLYVPTSLITSLSATMQAYQLRWHWQSEVNV